MPSSPDNEMPAAVAEALSRFSAALDGLEAAVADRQDEDLSLTELEEELAVMRDDRSRLAVDLDAALARASSLERARDEALRRIDRASAGVASVLGLTHQERD